MRALLCTVLLCNGLASTALAAATIELSKGETVSQLEWTTTGNLLLLTESSSGSALRLADAATGDLAVISVPRSWSALGSSAEFLLSPAGNGAAAIVPSSIATEPVRLWLYRLNGDTLEEVNLRKLDRAFYPSGLAWRSDGSELFVSARPYMGAEYDYSVIGIRLATEEVSGRVLKGNLDLISQIAYSPGRDALILKCSGIRGEYPAEPLIAIVQPGSGDITIMHAEASELSIAALEDGTVLLTAPQSARDRWALLPGSNRLRRSSERVPLANWTASADGQWLGGIADGKAIGKLAGQRYGVLRNKGGGRTVVTATPCRLLRFDPDGASVAAVSADGTRVAIIALPAS